MYLLVPFVFAELEGRVRAVERDERILHLGTAQRYFKSFVETLDDYGIVPETEKELYNQRTSDVKDMAKRRDLKIEQFRKEKDLRGRIEVRSSL